MPSFQRTIPGASVLGLLAASLLMLVPVAHAQDLPFERITTTDGLSHPSVSALVQDHAGFMWIGTQDGLSQYDGYDFETFRHHPLDSTTLTNNRIESLAVDHTGTLWVGTADGLNRFDRDHNRFVRYQHEPDDPHSPTPGGQINALLEDHHHRLWIGTQEGGLFRYDPERDTFTRFLDDPDDPNNLLDTQVRTLLEDRRGHLWVGTGEPFGPFTGGGLLRFDPETGSTRRFLHEPGNPSSLIDDRVSALYEDRAGTLWVGTCGSGLHQYDPEREAFIRMQPDAASPDRIYAPQADAVPYSGCPHVRILHEDQTGVFWTGTFNGGLNRFDPATRTLTHHTHDSSDPTSLSNNLVWTLVEDRHGTLWIGTQEGGLHKLDPYAGKFTTYAHDPEAAVSLSHDLVTAIYEAPSEPGVLWIGTGEDGLNRLDRRTGLVTTYRHDPGDPASLGHDVVNAIHEDGDGALWIGTNNSLDRMDRRTGRFEHYRYDPENPNSLSPGSVQTIYEDQEGVLWIGNFSSGLSRFDRAEARFIRYEFPAVTGLRTYDQSVYPIYEDRAGTLWVGTFRGGVYRFDRGADAFIPVLEGPGALALHEDASGRFWLGTQDSGLLLFDRTSGEVRTYTAREGLPGNQVTNILEDEQGHLWLSTANGLSRFDPSTDTFVTYDVSDGLPSNTFNFNSAQRGSDDRMYFGTDGGLVAFLPEEISANPHPPEVVLTGLKIFNEPVEPGAAAPLNQWIAHEDEITLTHVQHDLTLEYVGLHYANPAQNRYRYRLEGYDEAWIDVGAQRGARYTNLGPGDYVFRVQAANSDGVWNEEGTSIRLTILPPWWRTTWAYALYGLLLIAGVFAVDRVQRSRLIARERERARERELEQAREIERAYHELRETKDRLVQQEKMASLGQLTAGIAHEIKNPLNFVNNFADLNDELADELREALAQGEAVDDLLDDLKQNARVIAQHGKRADAIVQAMMQHASGGSGQREATDLNALVSEHIDLFYYGRGAKVSDFNVDIERDLDAEAGVVNVVSQEIGRVVLNLLDNAFDAVKAHAVQVNGTYRPTVTVSTRRRGEAAEIRVSDNGPGIPAEIREKIFEPFFTTKPTGRGTGLGLSLSYDIVRQGHGGTLTVESTEGTGSTFVVTLPVNHRGPDSGREVQQ